jgi:hypothetical protein
MDADLRSRAAAVAALTDAFRAEHVEAFVLAGARFIQARTMRLMADQEDVRRLALALPETTESDEGFAFSVRNKDKDKGFVWSWKERVQPKQPRIPRDDVIAVRVVDQRDKAALLAADEDVFFTEPHYNGFPAVLVRLPNIELEQLEELIVDAWRCQAPRALVKEWSMRSAT